MFSTAWDFQIMVDSESVIVTDPLGTSYGAVNGCQRLGGHKPERAPSYGKYLERRVSWRLPQPYVNFEIEPRWVLTDTYGVSFVVLSVTRPDQWQNEWCCVCNSLKFDGLVDDTVQVYQATAISSSTGERRVTETAIGSPTPCAIEPEKQDIGIQFGTVDFCETFLIYLQTDPAGASSFGILNAGALLVDQNGVIYEVQEVFKRERIDQHLCMKCIKKL